MKRKLFGWLLGCWALAISMPAFAAPSVNMALSTATGQQFRNGGWVTVLVTLENQGGEFPAELIVEPTDQTGRPQYVVPLTLPAGGKKVVPVDIPTDRIGTMRVTLRSEGTEVAQQRLNMSYLPPETQLVAVLSDDEEGIAGISQLSGQAAGQVQVVRLDAAALPARGALLENYGTIALSRFDAGKLSPEQLQALEAWVGRGGTLLLAGGPEWKRTLAPLPASLIPVAVTGTAEADLSAVSAMVDRPITGKAPVSTGRPLRGQVLAAAGEIPLVVVDRVGTGRVVYQAFDPGLEPVAGWTGQAAYFERLLGQSAPNPDQFGFGEHRFGQMQSALQRLPGLALPAPLVMASLLGGYLLLVGPVNYWLLKRKDRREWAWVSVPVISLVFVGAVYGSGYSKQVSLLSHLITVTQLSPGTDAASIESYVGVYAPSRDRLEVTIPGGRLVRPLDMGSFGTEMGEVAARVVAGDQTRLELLGLNNYSMRGYMVHQEAKVKGGLSLVDFAVADSGELTGRVANGLDRPLVDAYVMLNGTWVEVGTLQPGQTSEPFTLGLNLQGGGIKGGMPMPFMRVGPTGPSMEEDRRQMTLSAVFGWEGNLATPGALTVVGWTAEPVVSPDLPELGRQTSGTNLVYAEMAIPATNQWGDIPAGVIVGTRTGGGGGFGRSPYGFGLAQGTHTFRFNLPPLDPARVAELHLHLQYAGGSFSLKARNQVSGEWVAINALPEQKLENWAQFVGPGGVMEIEINVADHMELSLPTVSVKGVRP